VINAGDTIHNPITGERITFLETAHETDGEKVVIEVTVEPNGFVASPHVHPVQTERFTILEGNVSFWAGREEFTAGPGEQVTVPPKTPHKFWNAGDEPARFVCEVSPALGFAELLETMFALANDGKTNRKGLPNPLRMAVIAYAHRRDVRAPYVPALMQSAGLAVARRPSAGRSDTRPPTSRSCMPRRARRAGSSPEARAGWVVAVGRPPRRSARCERARVPLRTRSWSAPDRPRA